MSGGSIRWEGVDGVIEALARLDASARDALPALADGARVILDRSNELVPKAPKKPSDDEPSLVSTAFVEAKGENRARFGYSSVYAHWIHENIEFHHPHGGQAKFLEAAVLEKHGEAVNAVADHIFRRAGLR